MSFGSKGLLQIYFSCKEIKNLPVSIMPETGLLCSNFTFMVSIKMIAFCKNSNCPSSEKLLAFQKGETRISVSEYIKRHLMECEFCTAEVELYARYPQSDDPVASADIPPYLFELADALLGSKDKDFKSLNKLLSESGEQNLVKI